MLVEILKRAILRGDREGLREKIDLFYAASRLTDKDYQELVQWLAE